MSELAEMATTIVISTLPPSSPGMPNASPATPPLEHVEHVTPALFANPPLNYQLYSIFTSGSQTKTSVLSISQVNNDTKVRVELGGNEPRENMCPLFWLVGAGRESSVIELLSIRATGRGRGEWTGIFFSFFNGQTGNMFVVFVMLYHLARKSSPP